MSEADTGMVQRGSQKTPSRRSGSTFLQVGLGPSRGLGARSTPACGIAEKGDEWAHQQSGSNSLLDKATFFGIPYLPTPLSMPTALL